MSLPPPADGTAPSIRVPGRMSFWTALATAVAGLVVTAGLVFVLLWPSMDSTLRAETADGSRAFAIAAEPSSAEAPITVRPGTGWLVQPVGDGIRVQSPDRLLVVDLSVRSLPDAWAELAEAAGSAAVLFEMLASGLELRHFTLGETLFGLVSLVDAEAQAVRIDARTEPPAELADYRPALAELIGSIEIGGAG